LSCLDARGTLSCLDLLAACCLSIAAALGQIAMGVVASPSERRVGGVEVKTFGLLVSCYRLGRWAWAVENGPWSLGGLISLNVQANVHGDLVMDDRLELRMLDCQAAGVI